VADQDRLKATAGIAYNPAPFYRRQTGKAFAVRLAVWTANLAQLKALFYDILEGYPDEVEVLLSVPQRWDEEDNPVWQGFYNQVPYTTIINAIRRNEEFVFQDGSVQLCLKIPGSPEYIALDDHGILFIYFDPPEIIELLAEHGFAYREESLIYESPHWHVSHRDDRLRQDQFVSELGLKEHS